ASDEYILRSAGGRSGCPDWRPLHRSQTKRGQAHRQNPLAPDRRHGARDPSARWTEQDSCVHSLSGLSIVAPTIENTKVITGQARPMIAGPSDKPWVAS